MISGHTRSMEMLLRHSKGLQALAQKAETKTRQILYSPNIPKRVSVYNHKTKRQIKLKW